MRRIVSSRGVAAWLFQANPAVWRLFDYIRDNPGSLDEDWSWSCMRYRDRVSVGDPVAFWVSGDDRHRGVYALGRIAGAPYEGPSEDDGYWADPGRARRVRWHVDLRFHRWLLDEPILAVHLRKDPRFAGASVTRTPRAANPHPLTSPQWEAIRDLEP